MNHVTPADHEYQDGARYASLKGIRKARSKPLDAKSVDDYGGANTPQLRQTKVTLPPQRAGGQIVASVAELVEKLQQEAKVL